MMTNSQQVQKNFVSLSYQLSYQDYGHVIDYVLYHPMEGLRSAKINGQLVGGKVVSQAKKAAAFLPLQLQIRVPDRTSFRLGGLRILEILAMHIKDKMAHYETCERSGIAVMVTARSSGEQLAVWRWTPEDKWEVPGMSSMCVSEFVSVLGEEAAKPLVTNCRVCWSLVF